MVRKFVRIVLCFLLVFAFKTQAQDEGVKSPKYKDYKSDTSFKDFSDLRFKVARAQINALKNGGALLVRLKTNSKAIEKLRAVGNMDLATQLERETMLSNQITMAAYLLELKFCPVYFFFSSESDSIKQKKLHGVLVDTTLNQNSSIVCNANFYLIAEAGNLYNSSLGMVRESSAAKSIERGAFIREARIVVKNRYFIQLHKPFPYFQIKGNGVSQVSADDLKKLGLVGIFTMIGKHRENAKELKNLRSCVRAFNERLESFYKKNAGYSITPEISEFVY